MRRPKLAALWRYRPRALTLALLLVIATLIALANLCSEVRGSPDRSDLTGAAGWPLLWQWHHFPPPAFPPSLTPSCALPKGKVVWDFSGARLAGNLSIWILLLAASAAASEWLQRRCQPRLRFSTRTILVAVAVAGACCGWFVMARNSAQVEELLISDVQNEFHRSMGMAGDGPGLVWVEYSGPRWLDLVGAGRFCRRVVGAEVTGSNDGKVESMEHILRRLARVSRLKTLSFEVDSLTPAMADALGQMRRLRELDFQFNQELAPEAADALARALANLDELRVLRVLHLADNSPLSNRLLAIVGKQAQLQELELCATAIDSQGLSFLAGLTDLTALRLPWGKTAESDARRPTSSLLEHLPALPRLELLDLERCDVGDRDLRYLAALPKLKSLSLKNTRVTGASLRELAALRSLEELAIEGQMVSAAGLESLSAIKGLQRLHFGYYAAGGRGDLPFDDGNWLTATEGEFDRWRTAWEALCRSHPAIVTDRDLEPLRSSPRLRSAFYLAPGPCHIWTLKFLRDWFN